MVTINPEILKRVLLLFIEATDAVNTAAERLEKFNNETSSELKKKEEYDLPQIIEESVDFLKLNHIKEISKAYKPVEATEVVAFHTNRVDSDVFILSFAKNRVLLPNDINKLLVITAEGTSREVLNLFDNSKVIILK
ncbi:MAG: hypothetical protein K2J27_09120 [Duncaniella sp.]|nr:hypothetical protein [Duncaniella sp.]